MAIALNGEWASHGVSGTTQNVLASHAPVAGDVIVVFYTSNQGTAGVTDSQGATYTQGPTFGPTGGSRNFSIYTYYTVNVTSSARTIQCNTNANGQITASAIHIGGLATSTPFDKSAGGTGNSGSLLSANTPTTTFPNEILIGVGGIDGTTSTVWTAGGSYVIDPNATQSAAGTSPPLVIETLVVSATGAYNASVSSSVSINWAMGILTFADTNIPSPPTDPGATWIGKMGPQLAAPFNPNQFQPFGWSQTGAGLPNPSAPSTGGKRRRFSRYT